MNTRLLYYENSYIAEFEAIVISCEKMAQGFKVVLDKTAFFPEGGGQKSDTGRIAGVEVSYVQIDNGVVYHICKEEVPLKNVLCSVDFDKRFSRMQLHSGEHIVSGVAHTLYGCENVGFHMDDECAVVDFDRELTDEQLAEVEKNANEAVWKNLEIKTYFPSAQEFETLEYRSKLELTENVRIVEIDTVDRCACCAPHVAGTGEIGVIKIVDRLRHRGGVRFTLKCGKSAFEDYCLKHTVSSEASSLLSVKHAELPARLAKLISDFDVEKRSFAEYKMKIADGCIDNMVRTSSDAYFVTDSFDSDMMRELVNVSSENVRISAVFSGDDGNGYSYIAASRALEAKELSAMINAALNGRGGGRDGMVQGKVNCTKTQIAEFFGNVQE